MFFKLKILLGFINGGIFTRYLSKNLLNSFTIGSAIIIIVSQIKTLLGVYIVDENIPFKLIDVSKISVLFKYLIYFYFLFYFFRT